MAYNGNDMNRTKTKNMKTTEYLHEMYNGTSTDDGNGEIETYEAWLERQLLSRINKSDSISDVSDEIQTKAKKDVLNSYYVAIFERRMTVADIMKSIESDFDLLNGKTLVHSAKNIINGR